MTDFSIELSAERIVDARTKQYFGEVMRCYNNACFRSAVVMLWLVLVCDLLFKLSELADHYGDVTAKSILRSVETARAKNTKSPEWEWQLVGEISARTQLLEAGDFANLESLVKHRHLSAHPVLSATEVLFEPSKDMVRAHIRNVLEGVLTKPSIMTKKVFDAFVEDLEAKTAVLPDKTNLAKYLNAKYFPHLVPYVEQAIFRGLWRLVFRSSDSRCEKNREVNLRALSILYEKDRAAIKSTIEADRHYFSEIGTDGSRFSSFIQFMGHYPELFSALTNAARTPLESAAKADVDIFAGAWFLSESPAQHLDALEKRIYDTRNFLSGDAFDDLLAVARDFGMEHRALDVGISQFARSHNFDTADGNFTSLIKPNLKLFSKKQLERLIKEADGNDQIYGRWRAANHHRLIKQIVDAVFDGHFDYTVYPHFAESVGIDLKEISPPDEDEIPF